jgi:hypothetical protein
MNFEEEDTGKGGYIVFILLLLVFILLVNT